MKVVSQDQQVETWSMCLILLLRINWSARLLVYYQLWKQPIASIWGPALTSFFHYEGLYSEASLLGWQLNLPRAGDKVSVLSSCPQYSYAAVNPANLAERLLQVLSTADRLWESPLRDCGQARRWNILRAHKRDLPIHDHHLGVHIEHRILAPALRLLDESDAAAVAIARCAWLRHNHLHLYSPLYRSHHRLLNSAVLHLFSLDEQRCVGAGNQRLEILRAFTGLTTRLASWIARRCGSNRRRRSRLLLLYRLDCHQWYILAVFRRLLPPSAEYVKLASWYNCLLIVTYPYRKCVRALCAVAPRCYPAWRFSQASFPSFHIWWARQKAGREPRRFHLFLVVVSPWTV